MTIRRLGSESIQQQTTVESKSVTAQEGTTQSESAESVQQPSALSQTEKAQRFQESGFQGVAMRSLLNAALPEEKYSMGLWDIDLNVPNPMELEANAAEQTLSAMSNEQLLQFAEAPGGEQALAALAQSLKNSSEITPAKQKQLDRISAAQFKPGPGLQIQATPPEKSAEYQASYLTAIRRTMMESPSFAKNMNEINNGTPPVKILLGRNLPNRLDSFNGGKQQILDLSDLEKLPATAPLIHPESTTQGQVLSHAMREAQVAAKQTLHGGQADVEAAHKSAVQAENEYRADIGQKSMRLVPPLTDETMIDTPPLGSTLLIHYDDGHSDGLLFDQNGNLTTVNGNIHVPF
jgi:hypothetical protein